MSKKTETIEELMGRLSGPQPDLFVMISDATWRLLATKLDRQEKRLEELSKLLIDIHNAAGISTDQDDTALILSFQRLKLLADERFKELSSENLTEFIRDSERCEMGLGSP